jgi:hypothetical protein
MKTIITMLAVAAFGCGGDGGGGDDAGGGGDPRLIAGGGVADGPIAGTLHVHVVEIDSSTPISGATVRIEAATPLTGTTAASGLTTFSDVDGPQTVTVTAPGHAAATWIGVAGTNVTIPLEPSPRTIPTAHVTGTIAGWNSLPPPSFGNYTLGIVLYSFLDDPSAPENSIAQPMNGAAPLNTCIKSALSNSCAWEMNTRIGPQVHTAVIVEGDPHGTNDDPSDDTYTLVGYAAGQAMTLTAGQQVTNEPLAMVTGMTPFMVTLPPAPAGLSNAVAIPELSLADHSGRIVFPLPTLTPANRSTQVLAATGRFAGKYEVVSLATPSATSITPFSSAFVHDVVGTATVASWLPPPTQVSGGATFAFTAPAGATFHTAQVLRGKTTLWNVTVLDSTRSFKLPALSPDPLGTGSLTFVVGEAEVPSFDPARFDVPTVKSTLVRASGAQATFSH